MKEKVIIFLTGLLLGAIILTGSIYIYTIANGKSSSGMEMPTDRGQQMMGENNGNPPEIPNNEGAR